MQISEDTLQRAIIDQWRYRGVPGSILAAIPNGGARSKATAGKLRAAGVLPGMPDLFAVGDGFAFIELKRPTKRPRDAEKDLSDAQKDVIPKLRAAGIQVFVSNDLDTVLGILEGLKVLRPAR